MNTEESFMLHPARVESVMNKITTATDLASQTDQICPQYNSEDTLDKYC